MTAVVIAPSARHDLETLIKSDSLPADTVGRFRRSVESLETFPRIGATLVGRWARYRFVLGPWRWMLVAYLYDEMLDRVAIVTIQDARSSRAVTASRRVREPAAS